MKINLPALLIAASLWLSCDRPPKSAGDGQNDVETGVVGTSMKNIEKSIQRQKQELLEEGYQLFDYVDAKTGDTVLMQQYYMAFLKRGANQSHNEAEADSLQTLHLEHLGRMYELGYADISGPFGDDGELRGITIYNVPTQAMADSLARLDPMVKAGRLAVEVRPWWAAKGFPLR